MEEHYLQLLKCYMFHVICFCVLFCSVWSFQGLFLYKQDFCFILKIYVRVANRKCMGFYDMCHFMVIRYQL